MEEVHKSGHSGQDLTLTKFRKRRYWTIEGGKLSKRPLGPMPPERSDGKWKWRGGGRGKLSVRRSVQRLSLIIAGGKKISRKIYFVKESSDMVKNVKLAKT